MKSQNRLQAYQTYDSPIGSILISANDAGITGLYFSDDTASSPPDSAASPHLSFCARQLDEYFSGERVTFDLPLDLAGTPFQLSVWRALLLIPYGATWSYGKVASQVGRPQAFRAVGGANHNNPVSIIVPCHRVIGSDGKLTGYGGGLWRKEWLLRHESGKGDA